MNRKVFQTCAAAFSTALGLIMAASAGAQTPPTAFPGDWPNLGGFNNRQGQNGDPTNFGSGLSLIRWLTPSTVNDRKSITLDDTSINDTTVFSDGPYSAPALATDGAGSHREDSVLPTRLGLVSVFPSLADWSVQLDVEKQASSPYLMSRRTVLVGGKAPNFSSRPEAYHFTAGTPMARNQSDPTVPQTPANLRSYRWLFQPKPGVARTYALYVHLPVGTTDVSSGPTPQRLYPQRYFVYEIRYGEDKNLDGEGDSRYIDVVDTSISGNGLVRLGAGGKANQVVFPFDGKNPISIRLFNTVPRNESGVLEAEGASSTSSDLQEAAVAGNVLVYADMAQAIPQLGRYDASPTAMTIGGAGPTLNWNVTVAQNLYDPGVINGSYSPTVNGTVISYQGNTALWPIQTTPLEKWRYSVVQESPNGNTMDNNAAGVSFSANVGWGVSTVNTRHIGADYRTSNGTEITPNPATDSATYAPDLEDGNYDIYAYLGGDGGGETYAHGAEYLIYEGTTLADTVYVDQSLPRGWVRIGNRRYDNFRDSSTAAPLKVVLSNRSNDPADGGRKVFADAIRFVSAANIGITSTPVHATVAITPKGGGTPVDTKVVIVADESGKIHCLDLAGNADGTTTEYWSYPSTPDYTNINWADPNLVEKLDGEINASISPARDNQPSATMPQSFDLSTATVARVDVGGGNLRDLLYIGSTNGRVYCIDMAGRGDFDDTTHKVGSTRRRWTYPSVYPTQPEEISALGAFRGSLVYGDVAHGASAPTIYVPARQGRMISLNAIGTALAAGSGGTTTVNWQYPPATSPTLPSILMTPTLQFGNVYFGTTRDFNDEGPGQFYALKADTGAVVWRINGTDVADAGTTIVRTDTTLGSFITGPVGVEGTKLAEVPSPKYTVSNVDTLYVLNDNGYFFGLQPANGSLVTNGSISFATATLNALSDANLSYTVIRSTDRINGDVQSFPSIVVPSTDGRLILAAARLEDFNFFEGYRLGGFDSSDSTAGLRSAASANNFLFSADTSGILRAFDNIGAAGGNLLPGVDVGGSESVSPNDPRAKAFRDLHVKFVTKQGYVALRAAGTDGTSIETYPNVITNGVYDRPYQAPGKDFAFEWGETAYILVYGFPYAVRNYDDTQDVSPPQINLTLSVEGRVVRQVQVDSRKFLEPPDAPATESDPSGPYRQNGYAVIPFTFQNAGANTLPPGPGTIAASISSAAMSTNNQVVNFDQDTRISAPGVHGARVGFMMANPLGISIAQSVNNTIQGISYAGTALTDPSDPGNAVNGSPDLSTTAGFYESQLLASAGMGSHGGTQSARVFVYDRSLMSLVRQGGIDNFRMARTNLQRQGGVVGLYRALPPGLYPNFEDVPVNFPNTSLDYPDIGREQIRAVKDANGSSENPLLTTVTLLPPLNQSQTAVLTESDPNPTLRVPRGTPVDMVIDIPRYQPPVNLNNMTAGLGAGADVSNDLLHLRHDALGNVRPQGYFGRVQAFVDSSGDGRLNAETREAFRAFNLAVGVSPQMSIQVGTPSVDLGSLAAGTGYAPQTPAAGGLFDPWNLNANAWSGAYRQISIRNDGNVNLLDLRLAKAYSNTGTMAGNVPWALSSSDNDPQAWLAGANRDDNTGQLFPGGLWSNIDSVFATPNPNGGNRVILPKPRVTDRVPTELVANPFPRANPNTRRNGVPAERMNTGRPSVAPSVAVAVPLGFPVGSYSSQIRVIEDTYDPSFKTSTDPAGSLESLDYYSGSKGYEAYSDPITLTFKVRETRMTNDVTPRTAPVIDGNLATKFRNAAPAAMRDAFGSLVVAWESDEQRGTGGAMGAVNKSLIYLASLDNLATFGNTSINAPANNSPLWDLTKFAPNGGQWFKPATPTGYPTVAASTLFSGGTVIDATTRYGSPSFPIRGQVNPLDPATKFNASYMAFTGETQLSTATGRITQSKVFLSVVTTSSTADLTISDPIAVPGDPQTAKGKPSVVQLPPNQALIFYGETSGGQSGIAVSRFDGSVMAAPVPLGFGDGFSSVFSPSATARAYSGGSASMNPQIVELSFAGKLRGRPNAEVYLGRLRLGTIGGNLHLVDGLNGRSIESQGAGSPFALMAEQTSERLVNDGNGVYRARGVAWSRTARVQLQQYLVVAGVPTLTDVLITTPTNTRSVDRQSGLISYDSRLGGKVYLDPELGTVKFVGGTPGRNAELRLTYTPTFLRVTPGGSAAYSAVNGMFDDRFTSEYELASPNAIHPYWFRPNGASAIETDNVRNDRFVFAYGRGAAGSGVTARPYSTTMRLGVRLPTRIATDANGNILNLTVTGATRPYQVDPANGRVYFQAEDEDREVSILYTGVNEATNTPVGNIPVPSGGGSVRVSFVLERAETPIMVDEAANDSALTAFLDPFTYKSTNTTHNERPPLVWLFYVSTRAGQPDVYFQTIAPRYLPFAK